ncbi:MAG TPA: redoxin family protein, partial [Caulobacteraceae bacterium]
MSEVQPAKERPGLLKWALIVAVLIGAAAVLYVIGAASFKPKQAADLTEFRRASLSKLVIPPQPGPAPDVPFLDANGQAVRIADFKGQVVVMNLWATWCPP